MYAYGGRTSRSEYHPATQKHILASSALMEDAVEVIHDTLRAVVPPMLALKLGVEPGQERTFIADADAGIRVGLEHVIPTAKHRHREGLGRDLGCRDW